MTITARRVRRAVISPRSTGRKPSNLRVVGDLERRDAGDGHDRRAHLNQRLRQAFIEGAEEDSRRRLGRGLTDEELERVLRRYPGDVGADLTRGFRF